MPVTPEQLIQLNRMGGSLPSAFQLGDYLDQLPATATDDPNGDDATTSEVFVSLTGNDNTGDGLSLATGYATVPRASADLTTQRLRRTRIVLGPGTWTNADAGLTRVFDPSPFRVLIQGSYIDLDLANPNLTVQSVVAGAVDSDLEADIVVDQDITASVVVGRSYVVQSFAGQDFLSAIVAIDSGTDTITVQDPFFFFFAGQDIRIVELTTILSACNFAGIGFLLNGLRTTGLTSISSYRELSAIGLGASINMDGCSQEGVSQIISSGVTMSNCQFNKTSATTNFLTNIPSFFNNRIIAGSSGTYEFDGRSSIDNLKVLSATPTINLNDGSVEFTSGFFMKRTVAGTFITAFNGAQIEDNATWEMIGAGVAGTIFDLDDARYRTTGGTATGTLSAPAFVLANGSRAPGANAKWSGVTNGGSDVDLGGAGVLSWAAAVAAGNDLPSAATSELVSIS